MKEFRANFPQSVNLRAEQGDETPPVLEGYAAVFNKRTVIWGLFEEQIAPGAFARALSENQDVRALYNHDYNQVLGRTKSGSLDLAEDETGLFTRTRVVNTDIGIRVVELVRTGTVDGMSFAFTIKKAEWDFAEEDEDRFDLRTITEIGMLYDVGPVTYPAYEQTSVQLKKQAELVHSEARSRFDETRRVLVAVPDIDGLGIQLNYRSEENFPQTMIFDVKLEKMRELIRQDQGQEGEIDEEESTSTSAADEEGGTEEDTGAQEEAQSDATEGELEQPAGGGDGPVRLNPTSALERLRTVRERRQKPTE